MMETISPAVCGTRLRTTFALCFFAVGAFVAALSVGLALSRIRGALPDLLLAPLALAGAVVVLGSRRQVPERWHQHLPLPVWASGYGAGLGAGILTYQPSAAFVSVALAVVVLHSAAFGVLAFAAFAVGRVAAAALPASTIDRLPSFYRPMRRLSYCAVVGLIVIVAAQPVEAAAVSRMDPAVSRDGTLALTERTASGATTVVVVPADGSAERRFPGASWPALDGTLLAYADPAGVSIVRWATGQLVAHLDGANSRPALAWPNLIVIRTTATRKLLVVRNMTDGSEHVIQSTSKEFDLGRPSVDGRTIVWHFTTTSDSRIRFASIGQFRAGTLLQSRVELLANPSVRGHRLVYVEQRHGRSILILRRLGGSHPRKLLAANDPLVLWTTANGGGAYVTLWNTNSGVAMIRHVRG